MFQSIGNVQLEHKKRGAREGSPWGHQWGVLLLFVSSLESDPEPELKLAHANGSARGGIGLDIRDLASAAAAIYAGVAGGG